MTMAEEFNPRANSLNALRLVFAVAVIVSHAWPLGGFGNDPEFGGLTLGTWAVAGFFVISGYLIASSRRGSDLGSFLTRRFLRIFPGLIVCLITIVVCFVPIAAIREPGKFPPSFGAITSFLLGRGLLLSNNYGIQGTLTHVPYPNTWDGSLWTLSYEVLWYLLIGLFLTLAFIRRNPLVTILAFGAIAAAHIGIVESGSLGQGRFPMLVDLGTYFLAGATLQAFAARIPVRTSLAVAAAATLLVGSLLGKATLIAALPLAYLCFWLGIKLPLRRIGRVNDISYGTYIYAFPVQQLIAVFGGAALGVAAYIGLSVFLTLPIAALSWVAIEQPALRRRSRRRPSSGVVA